jgi:hypothetical protein
MSESRNPHLNVNDLHALLLWVAGRVVGGMLAISGAFLVAAFVLVSMHGDYRPAIAVDMSLAGVCLVGSGAAALARDQLSP